MKTGDRIKITCEGRQVEGEILMASSNQKSLMIGFEAMLSGHVGMMPVLLHEDGVYRSIINEVEVELEAIR